MSDLKFESNEKNSIQVARGKRLAQLRAMANVSRRDLEITYGIPAQTLKGWELGRFTGLTEQGAKRVLTVLKQLGVQCSIGWLMDGKGNPPSIVDKSAVEIKNNNGSLEANTEALIISPPQEIELFTETHPNAIYMQVSDDGMEPFYFLGDYVAGERYFQNDIAKHAVGKYCIIETQQGEVLLRRLRDGSTRGYYSLQSVNENTTLKKPYLYDVELLSAAPVLLHRSS